MRAERRCPACLGPCRRFAWAAAGPGTRNPMTDLDSPVQFLKGVGPKRAEMLERLGIGTVRDLLMHFPRRVEDRRDSRAIADAPPGCSAVVSGVVRSVRVFGPRWRRGFRIEVDDGTAAIQAVWFRAAWMREKFKAGVRVVLSGKVGEYKGAASMTHPGFEIIPEGIERDDAGLGGIVPVHPATEGLAPGVIRNLVRAALDAYSGAFTEWLPARTVERRNLMPPSAAVREMHFPSSPETRLEALRRFKFEELFLSQTLLARRKSKAAARRKAAAMPTPPGLDEKIRSRMPFVFTRAQDRAVREIVSDMASDRPMNRLLEGDVGSGKTAVAAYAMLVAVGNGAQAAFMAPTEVLALQHHMTLKSVLDGSGVRMSLLEGGMKAAERSALLHAARTGTVDIVVGTHALIQEDVEFARLGLAVVDEQHKFGVAQRACILGKGSNPDFLVMTATPIPRTLALAVFGDLDVSVIDELPPGRVPPVTAVAAAAAARRSALDFVRARLREGRQAYFVFPAIEKGEAGGRATLVDGLRRLAGTFPGVPMASMHGGLPREEKERVMEGFRRGEIGILAATTVIEVGVDVPNATVMVIEDADRFGLAQLHQLRGRIGRGTAESRCFLFAGDCTPEALGRLRIIEGTADGFRIAEEDLKVRGPGEFAGLRQHGLPDFRVADLAGDFGLLMQAREDASDLVCRDPGLADPDSAGVAARIATVEEASPSASGLA